MIDEALLRKWEREDAERSLALLTAERERTGITIGTIVRRKSGKANPGVVVRMWARDGQVKAEVHWQNAVRWLGGKSDWHSKINLKSLVKIQ